MKIKKHLMLLIFAAGVFLRLWRLAAIPPFLNCDEVSFSYNAYAILKTGRDEFGTTLPLIFRAFNDWRPPVYTYLTIVSQAIVGINDLAVRLPTAGAGCLLIPVFYFFLKDIFNRKVALAGTFLLAFNPALILLSRTALDANVALLFSVLAIWFYWRGLTCRKKRWILGAGFFAVLAIFTYQATKIFLPLMFLALSFTYRRWLTALIPLILLVISSQNLARFTTLSIFREEALVKVSIERLTFNQNLGLPVFNFFANRRLIFGEEGILRYLDNFNPGFLFAPKIHSSLYNLPNFGYFHLLELVLFGVGMYVIRQELEAKKQQILLAWFLLSAVPASLLSFAPQITRILPIVPVIIIIASFGYLRLWRQAKVFISLFYLGSVTLTLWSLFVVLPADNLSVRQPHYKEMVNVAYQLKNQYSRIYVSNSLKTPYIYFLWYGRMAPAAYQSRGHMRGESGEVLDDQFDNFYFLNFSSELFQKEPASLFIGHPADLPQNIKVIKKIGCEPILGAECIWFGVNTQYNKT